MCTHIDPAKPIAHRLRFNLDSMEVRHRHGGGAGSRSGAHGGIVHQSSASHDTLRTRDVVALVACGLAIMMALQVRSHGRVCPRPRPHH